jgi:diaminopimelate epimerase
MLQIIEKVAIYVHMHHSIEFTKASGAGNDFVLIDNWDNSLKVSQPELAVALSSRPFGVGADGLLVLEKSARANFRMSYYNADGSYGGMCGNGGRCIARFAYLRGRAQQSMTFEALDHIYSADVTGERVALRMKAPAGYRPKVKLEIHGKTFLGQYVNTGSPHVVLIVDNLESVDVVGLGRAIRNHPEFQPAGTNVNFVHLIGRNTIQIRTYERGVENETLACGTGSVASAVVAHMAHALEQPILVRVRSGEDLVVALRSEADTITEASLEGSAHILFSGKAFYDDISRNIFIPIQA